MIQIEPVKAFTDNYIWLARTNEGVLVVDPGDSKPVIDFLTKNNLHLDGILITHHHFDHTGGIVELLKKYSISEVIGPPNCHKDINIEVTEGDSVNIIGLNFKVIEVPGHTIDHIAFYLEIDTESHLFCGDTIFSSGCGRVFEGTFAQGAGVKMATEASGALCDIAVCEAININEVAENAAKIAAAYKGPGK